MDALLASGTVETSPEAIATFLREHKDVLNTTQIGEYFGHHKDLAVPPPPPPLHPLHSLVLSRLTFAVDTLGNADIE
jgi:hypothetical protein